MKKLLLLVLFFFMAFNTVSAQENSTYLDSLSIGEYELSPNFDKYNNTYSLKIPDDVTTLSIDYTLEDENAEVEITGNELLTEDENTITIKVFNQNEEQTYKILVNKIKEEEVGALDKTLVDVSITKKHNMKIILGIIIISWLLLAYIIYKILFHKKRVK